MNKATLVIILLSLISCGSGNESRTNDLNSNQSQSFISNRSFKVMEIDSIGQAYIIYAKRNDSVFKIASIKEKVPNCNRIEVDNFYDLSLVSSMGDKPQKLDIRGIKVEENTLVPLDNTNGAIHDLFLTDNLRGLCYIKNI
ncbi:MAG: hypothetical protein MRY57_00855 [Candidatus Pacebacteria bacterium]|nr:hypothetical protein [Candidatus Paceibacterota bacterium]